MCAGTAYSHVIHEHRNINHRDNTFSHSSLIEEILMFGKKIPKKLPMSGAKEVIPRKQIKSFLAVSKAMLSKSPPESTKKPKRNSSRAKKSQRLTKLLSFWLVYFSQWSCRLH